MGLHPWEFRQYTYKEFVYKYLGYQDGQADMLRAIDDSIRWAAYCQIMPSLDKKYKQLPLDKIVPSRYEDKKAKPTRNETPQERAARHLARSQEIDRKKALKKQQKNAGQ